MTRWSDCCDLYEATVKTDGGRRSGLPGVYVLGSLCNRNEQIAITRQQVRALNLVHSIIADNRLGRGSALCVVGAGAAGLTAAAYASTRGVRVTVLESREPLWNLRGCHTRWLHPNLFPRWPGDGWDIAATNFPVMNWYADYADRVGRLLWAKFLRYVPESSVEKIDPASLEITCDRPLAVSWTPRHGTRVSGRSFDAVILAVGFGSEARMRDAAASVYWIDDALERANPHGAKTRYLVSGTGDGGLTDLLRLRIEDFRHHHLREILVEVVPEAVKASVIEIEKEAQEMLRRAQAADKSSTVEADRHLSCELIRVLSRGMGRSSKPFPRLRTDTTVVLTSRNEYPFSLQGSWPVSRFLAAFLLATDPDGTQYFSSGKRGTQIEAMVPYDGLAPVRFHMATHRGMFLSPPGPPDPPDGPWQLRRDPTGRDFDAVVYRHGTEHAIKPLLQRFGLSEPDIEGLEHKWTREWVKHGATSQEMEWDGVSHDYRRRHRTYAVRPPTPGRTPVGLLSRLVSMMDPGHRVPVVDVEQFPVYRTDLITDGLALQVAAIGERWGDGDPGWRMRGEIDLPSVVQAIRWIDQSLDCLKDKANCSAPGKACKKCLGQPIAQRRVELETHWILPRPIWLADRPGEMLMHVVAARAWSSRRMRYVPNGRRFTGRLRKKPLPPELFVVVDFPENPWRVVWARGPHDDDLRLARELGAKLLIHGHGGDSIPLDPDRDRHA